MKEEQLKRLVRLSNKSKAPLVILDADGSESVLLSLDHYETLVGSLTPLEEPIKPTVSAVSEVVSIPEPKKTPPVRVIEEEPHISEALFPDQAPLEAGDTETQFYLEPVE